MFVSQEYDATNIHSMDNAQLHMHNNMLNRIRAIIFFFVVCFFLSISSFICLFASEDSFCVNILFLFWPLGRMVHFVGCAFFRAISRSRLKKTQRMNEPIWRQLCLSMLNAWFTFVLHEYLRKMQRARCATYDNGICTGFSYFMRSGFTAICERFMLFASPWLLCQQTLYFIAQHFSVRVLID